MKLRLKKLWNWIKQDWFFPVEENGRWGVYHYWRRHFWNYPYTTKQEAKQACTLYNNMIAKTVINTYAESRGYTPFNWSEFLEKKSYQFHELAEAQNLAVNYVTCACSNQCATIPRTVTGCPKDRELADLGAEFYGYICNLSNASTVGSLEEKQKQAKDCLAKIEDRAQFIIRNF